MQTPPAADPVLSASAICDRLRQALRVGSDAALARALGVSRMTVNSWRTRDSRPYAVCIDVAAREGVDLVWLLTGRAARERGPPLAVAETGPGYAVGGSRLARMEAQLRRWWAGASGEEQAWLAVELRRRYPEVWPDVDAERN